MDYSGTTFGQRFADTYDSGPERADTPATVGFLADLAGDGPSLELAVGTGRVALPLAARGVRVDGIEISPEMVAKLRAESDHPHQDPRPRRTDQTAARERSCSSRRSGSTRWPAS